MYCFESDCKNFRIISLNISKKSQFLAILYNNYMLEIYSLKDHQKIQNFKCNCIKDIDPFSINVNNKKGIFGNFFKKIFEKNKKCFAKYQVNSFKIGSTIDISQINMINENFYVMFNYSVIFFESINEIVIIDSRGITEKIKFNTKDGGYGWQFKFIRWMVSNRGNTLNVVI